MEQEIGEDEENLRCPCKSSLGMFLRGGNSSLISEKERNPKQQGR